MVRDAVLLAGLGRGEGDEPHRGFLFRKLEQATGVSALAEISDFFSAMSGMFEHSRRASTCHDILRGAEHGVRPRDGSRGAGARARRSSSPAAMKAMHMPLGGVVFNRVHEELPPIRRRFAAAPSTASTRTRCARRCSTPASRSAHVAWLAANFVDYQLLARGEPLRIEQFRAGLPRRVPIVTVPNFAPDVHDLGGPDPHARAISSPRTARARRAPTARSSGAGLRAYADRRRRERTRASPAVGGRRARAPPTACAVTS